MQAHVAEVQESTYEEMHVKREHINGKASLCHSIASGKESIHHCTHITLTF